MHKLSYSRWVAGLAVLLVVCVAIPATTEAFTIGTTQQLTCQRPITSSSSSSVLFSKKVKKGKLGYLVDVTPSTIREAERSTSKTSSSSPNASTTGSSTISPALAQWAAQQEGGGDGSSSSSTGAAPATTTTRPDAVSLQPFEPEPLSSPPGEANASSKSKKQPSTRRANQQVRQVQDQAMNAQIIAAIQTLEDAVAATNNLSGILSSIQQLLQFSPTSDLRPLVAGSSSSQYNYRLAWVGSDDAICQVGTGLHKVPLARLQEVFLRCLGRNRIEVLEVIRILGPFPNVKNILQGNSKVSSSSSSSSFEEWNIVMDSMVDGTGKEILAGKEENLRRVALHVYFSTERAIVAVVPPPKSSEQGQAAMDPLRDNGKHVLVFIREDKLDEKLEALRVA